jgi:hypothetical protein
MGALNSTAVQPHHVRPKCSVPARKAGSWISSVLVTPTIQSPAVSTAAGAPPLSRGEYCALVMYRWWWSAWRSQSR